jgi:hypothetical protein
MNTPHTITAANIDAETYYNTIRLCDLTGYTNPPAAIKELRVEWTVEKDECGNIVRLLNA